MVETKGLEDIEVERKFKRLMQWCEDVNAVQDDQVFKPLYVKDEKFELFQSSGFHESAEAFIC